MAAKTGRLAAFFVGFAGLLFFAPAQAADTPRAMIVPGQMNVSATGAFTYTIPIAVPPGTAGMVPALSLDYSSQNGDGLEGLGWALAGLPSIGRCPRTLAQENIHGGVNYDANDRFCMEGQRLVAISGTYGANGTEYRTEIEGFSKIVSYGTAGTGPAYFKVWTKSGQIMEFGNTADSQLLAVGKTTARAWAVNKIFDTKGNYLTVTYTDDTTNGQAYPTRIDYTGNTGAGLATYNSVQFSYTTRGDIVPTYQAGSLQKTTVLLTNIKTYAGASVVSDYRLAYRAGTSLLHSRLTSVTLCDGSGICLAPTIFGWQGGTGTIAPIAVTPNPPLVSSFISDMFVGDFNGDGLVDIIPQWTANTNPSYCGVWNGAQDGTFSDSGITSAFHTYEYIDLVTPTWRLVTRNLCSADQGSEPRILDLNGDGLADLTLLANNSTGQSIHKFLINSGANSLVEQGSTYPDLTTWQFGDFNADGRSDLLVSSTSSYVYSSDGDGTFTSSAAITGLNGVYATRIPSDFDGDGCTDVLVQGTGFTPIIKYFCNPAVSQLSVPNWVANGYAITFGDFNGDGKVDILRMGNGDLPILYLSSGTTLVSTTLNVQDWGKYTISAGDFNGDGKADLLFIADGVGAHYGITTPHQIWLSTGSGFVQVATIANSGNSVDAPQSGHASIIGRTSDWNNDGAADIWIQKPSGDKEYLIGNIPELMTSVSNGIGSTTSVAYDRLNKNGNFYTKCPNSPGSYACGDAYPVQGVDGPLYIVSRVDASNGIGGTYSSTYAYAGVKSDLSGRGFLGFSSVKVTDLQTNVVQTTNYRTDFPYVGLISSQTKIHGSVTLNSVTDTYADTSPGASTDGVARHFVSLTQSVASGNDLDGTALPTTTTNYTYDSYGNALTVGVSVSDGSSKVTTNTYSNDATNWFLGRLLTTSVQSIVGTSNLTRHSSFAYDATSGLLTQEIVEPSSTNNLYLKTVYAYDAYGNRTSTTTSTYNNGYGAARATTASYDSKGEFQTGACNALSQCESWAYDVRFGLPTGHTGPNALTTAWTYDTFGRKTLETRPDGNKTAVAYAYCSGVNGGTSLCPAYGADLETITPKNASNVQNGAIAIAYYDALSRAIATDVQGFNGSWIRGITQYDAKGRVGQVSRPYFVSSGTAKWTVNTYDDLGRVTHATMPDVSVVTNCYHGLITSSTNNLAQTTVTIKNAQGLNATVKTGTGTLTACIPATITTTTNYVYDAEGDLTKVTDPSGNITTNTFDLRGRKTASSDPDMGSWSYAYDGFGELTSQTDAKAQTTTLSYDLLGRVTQSVDPTLTSTWTYGTSAASHNIGQLASTTTGSGYTRTQAYDSLGRPSAVTLTVGGVPYTYTAAYNTDGRIDTIAYPSGLVLKYVYVATYGYLSQVKDNASGTVYWTANTRDAEMHALTQTFGNGVVETQSFDANTGLVQQILAGVSNSVANFHYSFNTIGTLTQRQDTIEGYTENFCYDALNRVTNYALGASCTASGTKTVTYDALGNITSKSDVGTYTYGAGTAGPHAVTSIAGTVNGVVNPTYSYDLNGNMTAGAGRSVTWTGFNMVAQITQGTATVTFAYDSDRQRIIQTIGGTSPSTTTYLNALGAMSEKFVVGSTTTWHDFIQADGHIVAEKYSGGTSALRYFVLDHLGSVAVVMDDAGTVLERLSYDAWGQRRCANGTGGVSCFTGSSTTRGFTNQEEIDQVGLVNLNARIYDPVLGRFMSADPTVESPFIPQDLNRYSYVLNNPLSFTDPSGLCFLGCFWESGIFKAVFAVAVAIFVPVAIGGWGVFTAGTLGAIADVGIGGALSGALSAGLNGGNILQGMLFGGAQALAFAAIAPNLGNAIGSAIGKSVGAATAGRMIANGLIGGAFSAAGGGNFGSGFLAAGVGSLGGSLSGGGFNPGGMIASAMIGGVASVLGGGKFANGAITAAFAYAAGKIGSRDAGAPDDQFAGPGARSGKPWTTEDFVEHYFTGNGETVDLGDVGLGDQFRNSNSVRSLTGGFIDDTLNQAQPEYSASAKAGSDVTNEPNLFAVGRSTLFMRAQCALNSCVFHFSIRDWFKDPGTIGGIKFFGGYELPGGTPYRIYYDWTALRPYPGGGK